MAPPAQVAVVGLKALQKDLAKMGDAGSPMAKALRQAGRTAAEPVAAATRERLPISTRSDATPGRLANDVRVTASRTGAAVRMGRASIRYAGWVEFGGTRKTPHTSSRPFLSQGRYMFVAARELSGTAGNLYATEVGQVLAGYPWTNKGDEPHD